jgi:DNA-binding NarL/FixJ family response regulator
MGPGYAELRQSGADTARTQLGDERFDALAAQGSALPLPAALAVAMGGDAPTAGSADAEARLLTRREREVAALVADGLGNREIAERLFLSKRTVDSHIEHIFTKMGFTSRTQLANWVLERGIPD